MVQINPGGSGDYKPNYQDFAGWCMGLDQILPFLGRTIMETPPPWIANYFQQSWFGNSNYGNVLDCFMSTGAIQYAPTNGVVVGNGGGGNNEGLTDFQKEQLKKNHDRIKTIMSTYAETLDEEKEDTFNLKKEITDACKSVSQANYDTLLRIYNDKKSVIDNLIEENAKKELTSDNDEDLTNKVKDLNTKITTSSEIANFGVINTDTNEWDDSIDIMNFISTWNSLNETKGTHIIRKLALDSNTGNISARAELAEVMHDELVDKAGTFKDNEDLSEETKNLLNEALEDMEYFKETFDDKVQRLREGKRYSDAFDNLYRAIRIAQAEIADKKLENQYKFLGEDNNPYKNDKLKTELLADGSDLANEGLKSPRTVYKKGSLSQTKKRPTDKAVTIDSSRKATSKAAVFWHEGKQYYVQIKSRNTDNTFTYSYFDASGRELNKKPEGVNITDLWWNGEYKMTVEGVTQYYDKDGNVIDSGEHDGKDNTPAPTNGATTAAAQATTPPPPADGSVENALGTEYDSYSNKSIYNMTHREIYNMLDDLTPSNVIGFYESYAKGNKSKGLIAELSTKSWNNGAVHINNCNKIVVNIIKQAKNIGLNEENCNEYLKLVEHFGINASFEFTKNNDTNKVYTQDAAADIDNMLKALIEVIKKKNKP